MLCGFRELLRTGNKQQGQNHCKEPPRGYQWCCESEAEAIMETPGFFRIWAIFQERDLWAWDKAGPRECLDMQQIAVLEGCSFSGTFQIHSLNHSCTCFCARVYVETSKDNLQELVFPTMWLPGIELVFRLARKDFYPLNHLANQFICIL